ARLGRGPRRRAGSAVAQRRPGGQARPERGRLPPPARRRGPAAARPRLRGPPSADPRPRSRLAPRQPPGRAALPSRGTMTPMAAIWLASATGAALFFAAGFLMARARAAAVAGAAGAAGAVAGTA